MAWAVRLLTITALASVVAACAVKPRLPGCAGDVRIETVLYFGLSRADGSTLPDTDWERFRDIHIAPRFADGFTILDGQGFWHHGATDVPLSEATRIVIRIHDGADESRIRALIRQYKMDFDQEAVLRTDAWVCASF